MPERDGGAVLPIGDAERERMAAAAAAVRACRRGLAGGVIAAVLAGADFAEWHHFPPGEAYDPRSHAQYFYHAHAPAAGEHGHFHTFLRAEGMPPEAVPLLLPEIAVANAPPPPGAPRKLGERDEVSHLIAIAVTGAGEPVRLFTTNRWVTGETWYRAEDVIAMVDRFEITGDHPSALLNHWLGAMLQLFRPQIAMLLRQRDAAVMHWRQRRRSPVFEDRRLETPSSIAINLDSQLALADGLPAPPAFAATRLPRMADGWGED